MALEYYYRYVVVEIQPKGLAMKYLPLMGALLFYATPAIATNFVYVACDATLLTTVIDPGTSEVLDTFSENDTKVYKINTKASTIENKDSFFAQYRDKEISIEIEDGQITYNLEDLNRGYVAMKLKLNPPGEISGSGGGKMMKDGKKYIVKMSLSGNCKNADSAAYSSQ